MTVGHLYAEVYMNTEQAKEVLWQATAMSPVALVLTNDQMDAIEDASGTWVGNGNLKAWKTESGGWFIIDQVVGKHEMIDLAVALN